MLYEGRICRPSFEKGAFKLPIAVGCSYNACKFCCLFKYLNFREINDNIIFEEVDRVKNASGKPKVCFLGDGNAFHCKTERLVKIISYVKENIKSIEKFNMDATISDIKEKSDDELIIVSSLGVSVLYIGIETGLDEVLTFMNKEHRSMNEALVQISRLEKYGIRYSAHIMAGVSGKGNGIKNAIALAEFFNNTKPVSITNFTMFTSRKQKLYKDIVEGKFEVATEIESLCEIKELIDKINIDTYIDSFHDYIPFRVKGHLPFDKEKLISQIDNMLNKLQLNHNVKIYLISDNKQKEDVLSRAGYNFEVINEMNNIDLSGKTFDKELLNVAAKDILNDSLKEYNKNHNIENPSMIVSSVKTVVFEDKILGKPKDRDEAYRMLKMLSGKKHLVLSSLCVFYNGEYYIQNEGTEVYFYRLSDDVIYRYIDNAEPYDKCGGYDIQDEYFDFDENYVGSYNNMVGFPLESFIKIITKFV